MRGGRLRVDGLIPERNDGQPTLRHVFAPGPGPGARTVGFESPFPIKRMELIA